MALPTPPPYTDPIPNNPFYAPLNPYVCGPYFPVAMSSGIDITTGAVVPTLTNNVQNVLAAGPGITLTTFLGTTTITATGGGGGGGVTSVTGTAPIVSSGGATPDISINASSPTAIGAIAGYTDVTDTDFNTALGYCALNSGSGAGFANVAVGIASGYALTAGSYGNTLIGPGTGCAIDTGTVNTALGIGALSAVTSGFANVGIGICSGCAYTTESGNAVLGGYYGDPGDTNALILSDGAGNLKAKFDGLGSLSFDGTNYGTAGQVLSSNGAGAKPTWSTVSIANATPLAAGKIVGCTIARPMGVVGLTALGVEALDTLSTAPSNPNGSVAIGYKAMKLTTGPNNVAVGDYSLLGPSSFGGDNVAIGNWALTNAGGSNGNVAIGVCSGCNLTTGNYNVLIGSDAQAPLPAGDCQLVIGSGLGFCWLTGDNTKAIKPGAGIIDCAGSCGTAGQALLSTGSNSVVWSTPGGIPGWTDAGTVTSLVTGVTTNPSPGNVGYNKVYYRQLGAKEYEVVYRFNQSAPGSAGSGDYLFTLPASLQFDTTLQFQAAIASAGPNAAWWTWALPGPTLSHVTDGTNSTLVAQPLIYNATSFRLVGPTGGTLTATTVNAMSSSFFSFATFGLSFNIRFQFTAA